MRVSDSDLDPGLVDAYRTAALAYSVPGASGTTRPWDEAINAEGSARPTVQGVLGALANLSEEEVRRRARSLASAYHDRGVTFSLSGEERPFPLDPVPRVLSTAEWLEIESGVAQRVRALEMFLSDVYGEGEVLKDGIVPRSAVLSCPHFHRAAHGIAPVRGARIHVAGPDLIRDAEGRFRVLEDNVRVPSGVSYVIENRQAMARAFPELVGNLPLQPVDEYPARLLAALRATAPAVDEPNVVVLTPGVHNSAYVEHTLLARAMGVELVEGRDLRVRGGYVYMRTTEGERRVDTIYRRLDDAFLDPMQFRADSMLGVPGLLNAARFGTVTLANAVGNGVADDKLIYTYVPDLIQYYLGEKPILDNVQTYRLAEADQRAEALSRLDELVVKPTGASGGHGLVIGTTATKKELDQLRLQILESPRDWIAQPVVMLSTAPTLVDGNLAPRHIDLRPFAINDGHEIWVLPGGLTRVAMREGSLVVNSSQGGGSKDTWTLAVESGAEGPGEEEPKDAAELAPDDIDYRPAPVTGPSDNTDSHQQQMQQQQARVRRWSSC